MEQKLIGVLKFSILYFFVRFALTIKEFKYNFKIFTVRAGDTA